MNDFILTRINICRRCLRTTILAGVICGLLVILSRMYTDTVIQICNVAFAYTDAFIIFSAGAYGLGGGLLSFALVLITEILRISNYSSLYALSTYLIVTLISSLIAHRGYYRSFIKSIVSALLLSWVLAICWRINFTFLAIDISRLVYYPNRPYLCLFISAFPECLAASLCVAMFAPANLGKCHGEPMQDDRTRQRLSAKVTRLFILEALILCFIAIIVDNIFLMNENETLFSIEILSHWWQENFRLLLLMMSAAIPIAYIFNLLVMKNIVQPINSMSLVMDRYFDMDDKSKVGTLPDLNIHTGDEVERLYLSLQKMVSDMSRYVTQTIENERKAAHLTQGFMLTLAKAVDAKDTYTNGHSVRVAEYSKEISRRLGKSLKEQEEIYMMGLLHDIGKIGVPEAIINKNGKLTDEEFGKIKEHPSVGYEILRNVTELPALATGARWHHERYDGRGYPDGLKDSEIPEEARIIAVADAYDAMTSKRSYRSVMPQEKVREQIEKGRGSQFDPKFADIMLNMIDEDKNYKMHE
ncbi:MAG: HD-GYP domain-containing protein [Synergistaceae bacterium]|nr:HD-GYP domain-containing protein [Synergistaceae bacterium]